MADLVFRTFVHGSNYTCVYAQIFANKRKCEFANKRKHLTKKIMYKKRKFKKNYVEKTQI